MEMAHALEDGSQIPVLSSLFVRESGEKLRERVLKAALSCPLFRGTSMPHSRGNVVFPHVSLVGSGGVCRGTP